MEILTQKSVTRKDLVWRFVVLATLLVACVTLALRIGIDSSFEKVKQSEIELVLTAIEAGPLKLARYQSADLATGALKDLFERSGLSNRNFVSAKIAALDGGSQVFAAWDSEGLRPRDCIVSVTRDYAFADAFTPFRVTVAFDQCQDLPSQSALAWIIVSLVGLTLILAAGCAFWVMRPVMDSLAQATKLFERDASDGDDVTMVTYLPLQNLARKALESRALEKQAAIARMTAMLAHDVRKPFSILKMGIGMLGNARDPAGVKSVLSRLLPEIDKAVSSVDGLISDVMEVASSSTQLIQEPVSPESLIEVSLGEIFRVYPKADVGIDYDLRHHSMVHVHALKVSRVFSNIIGNAIQAMKGRGHVWFKTRERDGYVEFCLGNAGSVIPKENLPKLFEAFFTSGKKGGTGLGLAIAQKVVTAHGGKIWCESEADETHPDGKVEFFFTLPVAEGKPNQTTAHLPNHSALITKAILTITESPVSTNADSAELTLEDEIAKASRTLGRPLCVLVIDDEPVYRSALGSFLSRTPELTEAIVVGQADGSSKAAKMLGESTFDLIITDIDMGLDSLNGFDLIRQMRRDIPVTCLICVHSNRIVADDHRRAIDAGADAFLPKPMARAQLLRLVLQAAQRAAPSSEEGVIKRERPSKPEILVVDDNIFVLEAWVETLKREAIVHQADSPERVENLVRQDPDLAQRLAMVITDYNFDNSTRNGLDVGRMVKSKRATLPVLLSSDGELDNEDLGPWVDRVIAKNPVGLSSLPME